MSEIENQENAAHCLRIGEQAWAEGDFVKAKRMLEKSIRFKSTPKAEYFLKKVLQNEPCPKKSTNTSTNNSPSNGPNVETRSRESQSNTKSPEEPPKREFTPEQKQMADRINKCKTFYQILDIDSNEANEANIKKAYRKLAIKLHPDKNAAPGANEAFKKLGAAYAVLSDADKKRKYDLTDLDITKSNDTSRYDNVRRRHQGHNGYYEFDFEEFAADDIFNLFFGGGGVNMHQHMRRQAQQQRHHRQQARQDTSGFGMIMQLAPLLLIVGMTLITNLLSSDPPYSLHYDRDYRFKRTTDSLQVPYYTQKSFDKSFKKNSSDYNKLMKTIEADYKDRLRNTCYQEQQNKETLLRKGQFFRDQRWIDQAKNMKLTHCEKLEELRKRERVLYDNKRRN